MSIPNLFSQAGGDVRVGFGIHIRVDANRHPRLSPQLRRGIVQFRNFLGGLHVEEQDIGFEGELEIFAGFAHTGIDNFARIYACFESPEKFSSGDDVHPAALVGKKPQDGQVGVGFHGKAGQMFEAGEGIIECPEMLFQSGMGIKIKRCSHLPDHLGNGNFFATKFLLFIVEMVHL